MLNWLWQTLRYKLILWVVGDASVVMNVQVRGDLHELTATGSCCVVRNLTVVDVGTEDYDPSAPETGPEPALMVH